VLDVILIALHVGLRLTTEAYKVPSASMWPAIEVQDNIFVSRVTRYAAYGDVIAFDHERVPFLKRAMGLSGDHVEFRGNRPSINGWQVPRCSIGQIAYKDREPDGHVHQGEAFVEFLGEYQYVVFEEDGIPGADIQFDVPLGQVFVVGDNRMNSHDSRFWNGGRGGAVKADDVRGRATVTWFALDENGDLDTRRVMRRFADPPLLPESVGSGAKTKLDACISNKPSSTHPPKRSR